MKVVVYQDTEKKQASKETNTCPTSRLGEFKSKNQLVVLTTFNVARDVTVIIPSGNKSESFDTSSHVTNPSLCLNIYLILVTGIVFRDVHLILTKVALFTVWNRRTRDFLFSSLPPSCWIFHLKQLRKKILRSRMLFKLNKITKHSLVFFMCLDSNVRH